MRCLHFKVKYSYSKLHYNLLPLVLELLPLQPRLLNSQEQLNLVMTNATLATPAALTQLPPLGLAVVLCHRHNAVMATAVLKVSHAKQVEVVLQASPKMSQ